MTARGRLFQRQLSLLAMPHDRRQWKRRVAMCMSMQTADEQVIPIAVVTVTSSNTVCRVVAQLQRM